MKIMVIAPGRFSSEEIEFRKNYLKFYASPGTEIEVVPIKKGPESVTSPEDSLRLAPGIVERVIEAEENKFDAAMIHCFGDPGRDLARSKVNIPVVGACEATFHTACMLAKKFGIVGRTEYIRETIQRVISGVPGVAEKIVYFKAISPGIPVLELKKRKDELKEKFIALGKEAIEKNGAELIIGGCLAMFPILGRGSREDMEEKLGVPVLDGSAIGFKTAELLAGLRLRHNRLGFQ